MAQAVVATEEPCRHGTHDAGEAQLVGQQKGAVGGHSGQGDGHHGVIDAL